MITRGSGLLGAAGILGLLLACSPDRSPKIPNDTPSCEETCNAAWECGGVLENDLAACLANCDEEDHGQYRLCIADTPCEEMFDCKVFAPPVVGPEDTDTDPG